MPDHRRITRQMQFELSEASRRQEKSDFMPGRLSSRPVLPPPEEVMEHRRRGHLSRVNMGSVARPGAGFGETLIIALVLLFFIFWGFRLFLYLLNQS